MTNDCTISSIFLAMSNEEQKIVRKMEHVKNEYIKTSCDDDILRYFNSLLRTVVMRRAPSSDTTAGDRRETRALVYVGEAGAGKTESLDRLFRTHPALPGYNVFGSGCPLISVSVPPSASLKALGSAVLQKAGRPAVTGNLAEHLIWAQVRHQLQLAGVAILHLDEMHNLTDRANVAQIDQIRKELKALMVSPTWPVALVVSGLPSLVPEMSRIDEVRRRIKFVEVPLMQMPEDGDLVAATICRMCQLAELAMPSDLKALAARLVHAALSRFGIMIELVQEAIELALVAGSSDLLIDHFAHAYADRTGCGPRLNPFVAPDWAQLECSLVFLDELPSQILVAGRLLAKGPRKKGSR